MVSFSNLKDLSFLVYGLGTTGQSVVKFFKKNKVKNLVEKPKKAKSNLAVTGLYFFDNKVVEYSKTLKISNRKELEIVDLLNKYKKKKN